MPQEKLLKSYCRSLSKDRNPMLFDSSLLGCARPFFRGFYDVDEVLAQADSINFSQSDYQSGQLEDQLVRFEASNHPNFSWNRNFKKAKSLLLDEMGTVNLKSLVYRGNQDIIDSLPKKDTHAGYSYLLTGKRTKGEYLEDAYLQLLKQEEDAKQTGTFCKPNLLGHRTQASMPFDDEGKFTGTFKSKTRLVSMVDTYLILSELRYAKPFQSVLSTFKWYAGGKSDGVINALMTDFRVHHNHWLSVDYSGFDQSISSWLIMEAFDIVRYTYRFDPNFDDALFKVITHDFCNKSFIDAKGNLRYSNKGVPSGSMFTQIIDSLVNRLMILTYLLSKDISPNEVSMCIMGDDNIIFSDTLIDGNDLEGYLNANFGVQVNNAKSSKGTKLDDPRFLSRSWSYGGAYRNWKHVILKLFYPERFRNYANGSAAPELVLYSYYLAYPITMRELFNMDAFFLEYPNLENRIVSEGVQGLSGYAYYYYNYLKT